MNSCLRRHGTQAEQDRAREEWFATRVQKKKEAAAQEEERLRIVYAERKRIEDIEARKRAEQTSKHSWWSFWRTDTSATSPNVDISEKG
jgi:hypothetical protein